jgi:prepilin-type N-terminal cleavage/methylation domain-containing protein
MFLNTKKRPNLGFTLIELLVVISIIGILSTVVLGSLQIARAKARDQYRISNLRQMTNALELFYSTYGRYPIGTFNSTSWVYSCNGGSATDWIDDKGNSSSAAQVNWDSLYLSTQPHDPQESNCNGSISPMTTPLGTPAGYAYYSTNDGTIYALAARLENDSRYDVESTCQKWMILVGGVYPTLYNGSPCNGTMGWNQTTYFKNSLNK